MADDAQTKQDQPSEGAAAPPEKVAQDAAEAKAALAEEQAQEGGAEAGEATRPVDEVPPGTPDKPTAAEEPAAEKAAAVEEPAAEAPARSRRAKKAEEPEAAEEPKRRTRGSRGRRGGADKPAPTAEPKKRAPKPEGQRPVVRAQAKYVRTSARKARLVCDHIRGKSVQEARAILAHTPRAVARDWSKLLESAIANAEHNHELVGDELRIYAVTADEGPTLKRFRPRAMGRATRIRKRTSHLTITLTPKE
jgi:ribosomal protein L22